MISNIFFKFYSHELEVNFWEFNQYYQDNEGPMALIHPREVLSQCCRIRVAHREPRLLDNVPGMDVKSLWVTIGLTKVRLAFFFLKGAKISLHLTIERRKHLK